MFKIVKPQQFSESVNKFIKDEELDFEAIVESTKIDDEEIFEESIEDIIDSIGEGFELDCPKEKKCKVLKGAYTPDPECDGMSDQNEIEPDEMTASAKKKLPVSVQLKSEEFDFGDDDDEEYDFYDDDEEDDTLVESFEFDIEEDIMFGNLSEEALLEMVSELEFDMIVEMETNLTEATIDPDIDEDDIEEDEDETVKDEELEKLDAVNAIADSEIDELYDDEDEFEDELIDEI